MIAGFEHVGVHVANMDRSLDFYQKVFGLQLRRREFLTPEVELAFLHFPDQPNFELELICRPEGLKNEGIVNHLAFRVTDMESHLKQLAELGVKLVDTLPRTILGNVRVAFLEGPDGEKLELVER